MNSTLRLKKRLSLIFLFSIVASVSLKAMDSNSSESVDLSGEAIVKELRQRMHQLGKSAANHTQRGDMVQQISRDINDLSNSSRLVIIQDMMNVLDRLPRDIRSRMLRKLGPNARDHKGCFTMDALRDNVYKLAKTTLWTSIALGITTGCTYFFYEPYTAIMGEALGSLSVALTDELFEFVAYFGHEWLWDGFRLGYHQVCSCIYNCGSKRKCVPLSSERSKQNLEAENEVRCEEV